jgi:hypothetical protein
MARLRVLSRVNESLALTAEMWANALALALKFGWNPVGPSTAYLADGASPSGQEAASLADAWMLAMDEALQNPLKFYPTAMDMGVLANLAEFASNGPFTIGSNVSRA